MDKNGIRTRLTQRRLDLKMSRADLATLIGVREATLFRWERGGIANIPARSLADWQRALDAAESGKGEA